ncbi:MAG: FecR domain-containing protein [Elusimicrobiota bacterium]
MNRTLSAALSLLLAVSASAQVPASALARIGTAAAVKGDVKAVSAGAAVGRVVSSGKSLFLNDHVTTDAAGRLQVLLLDETIFTLGPNSDMVLDDFVYDPKTSAGKVVATIAKGTFRFVTGKVAQRDPSRLKIKVAVGTIGVRGSIGVGETGPGGTTIINAGARNADNYDDAAGIYAQNGGKTVNLIQPGVGTRISPDGKVADASFMSGDLERIMGALQAPAAQGAGRGGQGAGLGGRTATDASGRATAVGGLLASASADALGLSRQSDVLMTQSVQSQLGSGFPDGQSQWAQLAGLTGTGTFNGTGSYSGGAGSGSLTMQMDVNFGAQTIGGGASFIQASGAVSGSASILSTSYTGLTGNAFFSNFNPHLSGSGTIFASNLSLQNAGGIAAKTATMNVDVWTGAGPTSSGAVTGTR